ncbi:MAG TPA: hypothetical protein VFX53_13700 [Pedococcus sp.]|nr:hypothetical protein [Pedococcus sp.]
MPAVPCPSCQIPLPAGGASECPACHLPLTGPVAARLWEVDQSLATLTRERASLLATLRRGPAAALTPEAGAREAGPPGQTVPPQPGRGHRPRWSGQQVLLGVGVLLVLVAALVFIAVAWDRIGVLGQVLAMAILTGVTAYGAMRLSRHHLGSSAEALATLTGGLLLLDVSAARSLGLGSLEDVDLRTYTALTGLAVAVVLAALHAADTRIRAFAVVSLLAASVSWAAVLAWADETTAELAAVALVGAVVFACAMGLPRRLGRVRSDAVVPAVFWLLVSLVSALIGAFEEGVTDDGLTASEVGAIAVLAVIAAGGFGLIRLVLARRRTISSPTGAAVSAQWRAQALEPRWLPLGALAAAVTIAAPAAVTAPGWQAGPVVAAFTACLLAGGVCAVVWLAPLGATLTASWAESLGGLALVGTVVTAVRWDSEPAGSVTLAAVAITAGVIAVARPRARAVAAGVAALAGSASVGLAGGLFASEARVAALALAALATAAVAAERRGHDEEPVLGGAAVAVAAVAQLSAQAEGWSYAVAGLLAAEGLAATAYAVLPRRRPVVVLTVLAWSGAVWTLLADAGVETLEAFTLPVAALSLAGGLWLRKAAPLPSWLSVGPAAAIALLPSAFASLDDESLLRPMLTLVAAAVVLALGVALRSQAPVVIGAAAAAVVAVSQLAPYAIGAPRWLTLGLTGALLLALGARYEKRRADAHRVAHWLAGLR